MNMENFDDVIFDDDEFGELPSEQEKQEGTEDILPANQQQPSSQEQEDLTTEVLKLKGISNPEKLNLKMKLVLLQKEPGILLQGKSR